MTNGTYTKSALPPRAITFDRKVVTAAGIVVVLLMFIAFKTGITVKRKHDDTEVQQTAQPGQMLASLPDDYSKLRPTPQVIQTPIIIERAPPETSEAEKLRLKLEAERLERQQAARQSGVAFGVSAQVAPVTANGAMAELGVSEPKADSSNPLAAQSSRDEANRQDDKKNFLDGDREQEVYVHSQLLTPRSPYQIMAGTVLPGVMLTGINSDLPGQILGQISQNVFDSVAGRYLLVPQGTKVVGEYDSRISYGQERVLIVWTRLIFPNGRSITLEGMPGVDMSGYSGLTDQVNNHYLKLLGGVVFSSLLGASAQLAEGRSYSTSDPRYSELAAQGVAKNANDVGQEITRKNLNIQPTLEIRPGFRFSVFVNKDVILEPYKE